MSVPRRLADNGGVIWEAGAGSSDASITRGRCEGDIESLKFTSSMVGDRGGEGSAESDGEERSG